MKIRGYGDLLGLKQSGIQSFRLADPVLHEDLFLLAEKEILPEIWMSAGFKRV